MSRRRLLVVAIAAVLVFGGVLTAFVVATSGSSDEVTVYSARSHYGEEQPFHDFAEETGNDIRLFGGSASELYERIKGEGDRTAADVLITVDAANLWRAQRDGLLEPVRSSEAERNVPEGLRDSQGHWYGLTVRARTVMRSTERVKEGDAPTYASLGDPRWKGRLCLRTATSEYNISFVADRIAKDGREATERMLRSWMDNDPEVLGSDQDVLDAIADDRCDVGLTNSYYLGRTLEEKPDFPVAPVWADQNGRGTHVNLSGLGVVKGTDEREAATELLEFLTGPDQQRKFAQSNHEFGVGEGVEPTEEIARFGNFKRDPIDVAKAGAELEEAVELMSSVGWK